MGFLKWWSDKVRVKPVLTDAVGFSYPRQEVLRDVSLSVRSGEIVAIIGPSGSGKSTLLRIIAGIMGYSFSGSVKIFGRQMFSKSNIGFVPQEVAVIPDVSIRDNLIICGANLGLSSKVSVDRGLKLLTALKLSEDVTKTPDELSGGQRVRLNIVLSLIHDPSVLILDEPFAGLDFRNRRLLWHFLLAQKKKGKSILLTSHLLTETEGNVDRLIIVKSGKVFFSGRMDKLKEKVGLTHIFDIRCSYLSSEMIMQIKKYCSFKDIAILDSYGHYLMFGVNGESQKNFLVKFLQKLNLQFHEVSFREPNLDEVFLKE